MNIYRHFKIRQNTIGKAGVVLIVQLNWGKTTVKIRGFKKKLAENLRVRKLDLTPGLSYAVLCIYIHSIW